jgi:hypothetical protein
MQDSFHTKGLLISGDAHMLPSIIKVGMQL